MASDNKYKEIWNSYKEKLGTIVEEKHDCRPDFFVISPAKTCSTWLYNNLICHEHIHIKSKEMTYFSSFWQWYDINWYLESFVGGEHKCKGDVSGTYSLLSEDAIKSIVSICPDLKIVLFLRNPVERAWSQVRHYFRFKVGPFKHFKGDLSDISLSSFIENFWIDSYYLWSDYPSIIKRWLSCVPERNMFINFTDEIEKNPAELLNNLFVFLGAEPKDDLSTFPMNKKILEGLDIDIPNEFKGFFISLFNDVLNRLDPLLHEHFGISYPESWGRMGKNIHNHDKKIGIGEPLPNRDVDRNSLPRYMESFGEYNILFYEGQFHAISQRSGEIDLHMLTENEKNKMMSSLDYRVCDTPDGLKTEIENICLAKS